MKRIVSFLVAAVMVLSVFGMLNLAAPLKASADSTNLALGKTVTQDLNGCSAMGGNPGDLWYYGYLTDGETLDNYVDGTTTHFGWYVVKQGEGDMNASATIDLGSVQQICRIKIFTEFHFLGYKFPNTYDIYVSADGSNWTKVYSEANRTGIVTHAHMVEFDRTSARYVKVTIVRGNDVVDDSEDGGYVQYAGIGEIEVYNDYVSGDVALYKTSKFTVDDVFWGSGYQPEPFAFSAAGGTGFWYEDTITGPAVPYNFGPYRMEGWIVANYWWSTSIRQTIDLHAVYNIDQITFKPMAWTTLADNYWIIPNNYAIFVSEDGDTWTKVANVQGGTTVNVHTNGYTVNFDAIDARYVSLAVYQGSQVAEQQWWTGLGDFEVYGTFVRSSNEGRPGVVHMDCADLVCWKRDNAPLAPFTLTQTSEGIRVEKESNAAEGWTTYQNGDTNAYIHVVLPDTMNAAEYPLYAIEATVDSYAAIAVCYDNGWTPFAGMEFYPGTSLQVVAHGGEINFAPLAIMGDGAAITIKSITFYRSFEDYQIDIWERGYATYGATSANVSIGDSLTLRVGACFPQGTANPTLYVTDPNNNVAELTPVASAPGGIYYFDYDEIYPQKMADVLQLDIADGDTAIDGAITAGYSVQTYINALYGYTPDMFGYTAEKKAAMDTLLADLLTFGAASQVYKDYNTDNLADSYDWVASTKTPANTYTPVNVKAVTKSTAGDKFKAATLLCDDKIQIKVKFEATTAAAVKFTIDGITTTVPASEWEADGEFYTALSAPLVASRLSKTVAVSLVDSSDAELAGITYSVESYIASGASDDPDFCDALLNYGRSAKKFINTPNGETLVTLAFPADNTVFDKDFAGDVLSLNISNAGDEFKAELGLSGLPRNAITKSLLENYNFVVKDQVNYNKAADDRSHTSAFTYATGKILYNDELRDALAVVIEGSESEGEWYSNIDFAPSHDSNTKYSENFLAIAQNAYAAIQPVAATLSNPVVLITGFSRGAAAANLLGTLYNDEFGSDGVFVYTFATPNTVRSADVAVGPNIFNVVNPADPVTKVPFAFIGYYRAGNDVTLTAASSSAVNTTNGLLNTLNNLPSDIHDIYETKYSTSGSGTSSSGKTVYSYFESVIPPIFTGNTGSLMSMYISSMGISSSSKLYPINRLFNYAISNYDAVTAIGTQHKVETYFDLLDAL